MSVVPGTMALPVEVAVVYGGQTGQGGTAGGVKSWKILSGAAPVTHVGFLTQEFPPEQAKPPPGFSKAAPEFD